MGLRATIVGAVSSAFKAVGDIAETCTYRRTSSTYNPATGANVITNTDYTILRAIYSKYESFEIDKVVVLGSDVKMIVQKSELGTTVPNLATDKLLRTSDSKTYNIIRVSQDPAGATYTIQLRSPS